MTQPIRLNIIGGSETGKSYMVRNLIMGGPLRPRGDGKVFIISTSKESVDQPLWNGLNVVKIPVERIVINKRSPKPTFTQGSVIVFDDLDDVNKVPAWVGETYSIESHHSDISAVKISHKVKCGDTIIRGSTQGVILFNLPPADMEAAIKSLGLCSDSRAIINYTLSEEGGLFKKKDGTYSNHNKVFIDMRSLHTPNGVRSMFYKLNTDIIN